jgi:hypothetical protein
MVAAERRRATADDLGSTGSPPRCGVIQSYFGAASQISFIISSAGAFASVDDLWAPLKRFYQTGSSEMFGAVRRKVKGPSFIHGVLMVSAKSRPIGSRSTTARACSFAMVFYSRRTAHTFIGHWRVRLSCMLHPVQPLS